MGYAQSSESVRIVSLLTLGLGLILIAFGLAADANAAVSVSGCSAEILHSKGGDYQGCRVTMGNREFTVGPSQSSAEGCSQVCSIMAELGGNGLYDSMTSATTSTASSTKTKSKPAKTFRE